MAIACGAQSARGRQSVRSILTSVPADYSGTGTVLLVEYSTVGAAGPWSTAPLVNAACAPASNPTSLNFPNSLANIYDPALAPGTQVWVRWTVQDPGAGNPGPNDGATFVCGPITTESLPSFDCSIGSITQTSATITMGRNAGGVGNHAENCAPDVETLEWGTTAGGPYPNSMGVTSGILSPAYDVVGLTAGTTYFFRQRVAREDGADLLSQECSFTTLEAEEEPPVNTWEPQDCGPGGDGEVAPDVESLLLCDMDAEGNLLGTALAVYEYDETGAPVGAPTFVIPGTNDPYVVQGTLTSCDTAGCLAPVPFCFTTTSTGPVDHPGRQYDITLPINPGFAVESLQIDAVNYAANILWDVVDQDGAVFAEDLRTFLEGRLPAPAVVTITNPNEGQGQVCGAATPMQIHIECLRLDTNPPDLVELLYNGGQDVILNPAYNEAPPLNPPVAQGDYGFHLLGRQDNNSYPGNQPANRALCTGTANRGWETNDVGNTFEIWGRDQVQGQNVTPTPRGTPTQEMASDGPPAGKRSTIWQTFVAPSSGTFIIKVVHGGRDNGEEHIITLDNGDTDDQQNGDLINNVTTNVGKVTNNGGTPSGPWTQFEDSIPLTNGSTYTLALSTTNPALYNRGGLFTDMRAYIDRPGRRATATTDDDTCVVSVEETTTVRDAQYWAPRCVGGDIVSWRNVETGEELTNSAFWGQAPAPTPGECPPEVSGEGGGSVAANLVHNYEVCAIVGGMAQTVNRVVITDPSGGVLLDQFVGANGGPVTPTSYTIGACSTERYIGEAILCDITGAGADAVETRFLRKWVQSIDSNNIPAVNTYRDFTLTGVPYVPTGTVQDCNPDIITILGEVCWVDPDNLPAPGQPDNHGFLLLEKDGTVTLRDLAGQVVPNYQIVICASEDIQSHVLCDFGNNNHQFLAVYYQSTVNDRTDLVRTQELDGETPYTPVGPFGLCVPAVDVSVQNDPEQQVLCDDNGSFIRHFRYDETGNVTATHDTTLDGVTAYVPVGTVAACAGGTNAGFEIAEHILCDDNGSFVRRTIFDESGLLPVVVQDFALDGTTPYVTSGTVVRCSTPVAVERDVEQQILCDNNGPFIRRTVYNVSDGSQVSQTDLTLAGAPYVVSGSVGLCGADREAACWTTTAGGTTVFTGTIRHDDRLTGPTTPGWALFDQNQTFVPANTPGLRFVICASSTVENPITIRSQHQNVVPGSPWTPPAGVTILSVAYTVLSGTATVVDFNGTSIASIPSGVSATWSTDEDQDVLTPPQSITSVGGRIIVTWTER